MSEQENIQVVRRIFDALNSHDLETGSKYYSRDVRVEAPNVAGTMNLDQTRKDNQNFLTAFPDVHFDLKDIIAQGDRVAVSYMIKGTHKAPLANLNGDTIPATNRSVTQRGVSIFEIRNNQVSHQQDYWDQVTFLTQLGVISEQDLMRARR